MYDCTLTGKYVGLSRICNNGVALGLAELMAFDTVIVEGTRTVTNDVVGVAVPNAADSNFDVTSTQNI
jgi:hypothetical protein